MKRTVLVMTAAFFLDMSTSDDFRRVFGGVRSFGWVLSAKLLNHRRFREQMAVPSKRVDRSILSFSHCLHRESNLEVLAVNSHGGSSPPPRTPTETLTKASAAQRGP